MIKPWSWLKHDFFFYQLCNPWLTDAVFFLHNALFIKPISLHLSEVTTCHKGHPGDPSWLPRASHHLATTRVNKRWSSQILTKPVRLCRTALRALQQRGWDAAPQSCGVCGGERERPCLKVAKTSPFFFFLSFLFSRARATKTRSFLQRASSHVTTRSQAAAREVFPTRLIILEGSD